MPMAPRRLVVALLGQLLATGSAVRVAENEENAIGQDADDLGSNDTVNLPEREPSEITANFGDIIWGRNYRLDAQAEQDAMQGFVLQESENVLLAFKCWLSTTYFTTDRILFKREKLLQFPRSEWTSLSYGVIKAWSMRTSGTFLLQDTALKIWTSVQAPEASILNVTFRNTTEEDSTMLLDVNLVLTQKVLGVHIPQDQFSQFGSAWGVANLLWIWGRSEQRDRFDIEAALREHVPLLGPPAEEQVRFAYQLGRDFQVWTNKRLILIDVRWWTGRIVEYLSIPWEHVATWSVESAEIFDITSELTINTPIPGLPGTEIKTHGNFREEHELHRIFAEQIMKGATKPNLQLPVGPPRPRDFFTYPPVLTNGRQFRETVDANVPALLNDEEVVHMAGKGLLESFVATDQRFVRMTRNGWRSMRFQTVPWTSVRAFAIRYDDGWWNKNAAIKLWTGVRGDVIEIPQENNPEVNFEPGVQNNVSTNNEVTSETNVYILPGDGLIEYKFNAVFFGQFTPDLVHAHRVMSEKVLGLIQEPSVVDSQPNPNGAWFPDQLRRWLEGDAGERPLAEAQSLLSDIKFLLPGEQVTFALRLWRNTMVMTEKRIVKFKRHGLFGRIWEYTSIPYTSVVAFQLRSAGVITIGGEVRVWTNTPADREHVFGLSFWDGLKKSLEAGRILAEHVLLTEANGHSTSLVQQGANPFHWLFGNFGNIDPEEAYRKIQNDAPLLEEEHIFAAFKVGRDMIVLTSLRMMHVDVQWFSGQSIQYRSIPYSSCRMWRVDFGMIWHSLDIWTDVHRTGDMKRINTRFQAGSVDVARIDNFLRDKILLLNKKPSADA